MCVHFSCFINIEKVNNKTAKSENTEYIFICLQVKHLLFSLGLADGFAL